MKPGSSTAMAGRSQTNLEGESQVGGGSMLNIQTDVEFRELASAATYKVLYNELRAASVRFSIIGTVLGLVSILLGAYIVRAIASAAVLGAVLGVLGVTLTATSIWMLSALTAMAALLNGLAWLSVGGCFIAAGSLAAEGAGAGIFIMIGSWFSFRLYSPLSALQPGCPPEKVLDRSDQIVKDIRRATIASDHSIIEFGNGITWRGWLGDVGGIFVGQRGWDVFFLKRGHVSIEREEGRPDVANIEATFRLGEYSFSGTISSEAFRRYEEWKHAVAVP